MLEKYSRQILFADIGERGQKKLLNSKVVLVGCGALGTVQAETLVRAGVGNLLIVDRDVVEESNLQRQFLFDEADAHQALPKAIAAERKLRRINSDLRIKGLVEDVNHENIAGLVAEADLVLDGTDNFETRFLINDAALKYKIPWIYGACLGSHGLSMTVRPGITPCLRCIFEKAPPADTAHTCDTAGIIAPIVNIIASVQVCEALKLLTGNLEKLLNKLVQIDVWEGKLNFAELAQARNENCAACVQAHYDYLQGKAGVAGVVLCGRNAVQINRSTSTRVDFPKLAEKLRRIDNVMFNEFLFKLKVDEYEITVFPDGRGIVKGTDQVSLAKSIFSKYIGV